MKIIRVGNHLTVCLDSGEVISRQDCDDELHNAILAAQHDEVIVKSMLLPGLMQIQGEVEAARGLLTGMSDSKYLTVFGDSVYLKKVSELTLPSELSTAILKAELDDNKELVITYINFWTLCCLNPDSRARTNLFWFLNRYGMTISKSGLFVAYRNVNLKREGSSINSEFAKFISSEYVRIKFKSKKSPKNFFIGNPYGEDDKDCWITTDKRHLIRENLGNLNDLYLSLGDIEESPTYTDSHTGSFDIKLGEPVSIDRDKCDPDQDRTCSKGLHVAGREWLTGNSFGNISVVVLVNPADVVAVPPSDNYGKMRVCCYYPVQIINKNEEGEIINVEIPDAFEDDFMHRIAYSGEISNEEDTFYKLNIPIIPEVESMKIRKRLKKISQKLSEKMM